MKHKKYNWKEQNSVVLLEDSINWIPAMRAAIENSQQFVLVELYLVESGKLLDEVIEVLVRAAERGICIYILLDGYGSAKISRKHKKKLEHKNIILQWFNPLRIYKLSRNFVRNHRKLVLIDDKVAFVGGFGFTDDYIDKNKDKAWCDVAILLRGECVGDWRNLFFTTWKNANCKKINFPKYVKDQYIGNIKGRLVYGQGLYLQKIKISLLHRLRNAREKVWITTPYFVPTLHIRNALKKVASRGVDVRLLLPGAKHDHPFVRYAGQRFYKALLKSGVKIYEYQPRFIHAKISLCDNWTSVGSCNFDHWGLRWNLEANQEIVDINFSYTIQNWFEKSIQKSKEIKYEDWIKRGRFQRIKEYIGGILSAITERLR